MGESTARGAYTETDQATGQRVMLMEGMFSRAMEGLTGGVVLAGFALALGANEFEIGLVAAIPFLAQLANLPAALLLARFPDRKRLAVGGGLLSRVMFLAIGVMPFLALPLKPLHALVPLLVGYAVLAAFSGAAWQVWVRELVPRSTIGRYFGKRMAFMSGTALVTLLGTGQFLAWWERNNPGREAEAFGLLFAAGAGLGFVGSLILSRAPSAPVQPRPSGNLLASLSRPVKERNYRRVLLFLGSWGFAANFALPFLAVVLLKKIGYGFDVVTMLAAVSILANILGFRVWAPITDHFGNKPVLGVSAMTFIATMVMWAFVPKVPTTATLVAAGAVHILLGFANAGMDVGSNGVIMKLAPDEDAATYLASASTVRAFTMGIGPLVGGTIAAILAHVSFSVQIAWTHPSGADATSVLHLAHYDFMFLASALLGTFAVHRLLSFEETGDAPKKVVVRAMRREIAHVSTIAGMRTFAHIGSYVAEAGRRVGEKRRRSGTRRRTPYAPRRTPPADPATSTARVGAAFVAACQMPHR